MHDFDAAPHTVFQAHRLTVRRGAAKLFEALSFKVHTGQLVWLRGANGSGKTSLLRTVAGLSRPEAGHIFWPDHAADVDKDAPLRTRLVYLGHSNGLKDDLTAMEALQFLARLHGRESSVRATELAMQRLGVWHCRHLLVRALSQGQSKRVALARLALERQALLWLLDEPLDGLDEAGIATVHNLIYEHVGRAGAVLLTSHIPLALEGIPTDVLVLDRAVPP